MNVNRYECFGWSGSEMRCVPGGGYVSYSDYAALSRTFCLTWTNTAQRKNVSPSPWPSAR